MGATREQSPAILIVVDDDQAVLEALKFAFEVDGYSVQPYSDGESLLKEETFPDMACLVVDYKLPRLNGLQIIDRLRRRGVTLPAVLITTPTPGVLASAKAAGVPVVGKPLLTTALIDTVRRLLAAEGPASA
ncbi:MAG: response regulator [Caulobacteraceae bacterium]